jgi:hypothetical protein
LRTFGKSGRMAAPATIMIKGTPRDAP